MGHRTQTMTNIFTSSHSRLGSTLRSPDITRAETFWSCVGFSFSFFNKENIRLQFFSPTPQHILQDIIKQFWVKYVSRTACDIQYLQWYFRPFRKYLMSPLDPYTFIFCTHPEVITCSCDFIAMRKRLTVWETTRCLKKSYFCEKFGEKASKDIGPGDHVISLAERPGWLGSPDKNYSIRHCQSCAKLPWGVRGKEMPPERIYPTGTRDLAPVAHNSREHGDIFQENKDGFTHVYKLQVNTTLVIILKGGGVICFRLAGIN